MRIVLVPLAAIFAILVALALFLGGDERQALCDKAVEKTMKGKASFKILEVISDEDEGPVEGKGISGYKYIYRYYTEPFELHVGGLECIYGDSDQTVSLYNKRDFELP